MKERFLAIAVSLFLWSSGAQASRPGSGSAWVRWIRPQLDATVDRALLLARVGQCHRAEALLVKLEPRALDPGRMRKVVDVAWLCGRPRLAAIWLRTLALPPMSSLGEPGQAGAAWAEAVEAAGWWRSAAAWFLGVGPGQTKMGSARRAHRLARGLELLLAHGRVSAVVGHLSSLPVDVWLWPAVDIVAGTALLLSGRIVAGRRLLERVCAQRSLQWLGTLRGLGRNCRGFYRWLIGMWCGCRPSPRPQACPYGAVVTGAISRPGRRKPVCGVLESSRRKER